MDVKENYKKCPLCGGTPEIENVKEIYFIECECGLCLVMDHEGTELL